MRIRYSFSTSRAVSGVSPASAASGRGRLLLVIGYLRRLLELHLELVDEAERGLAPSSER